jgi:amino acid transporter
MIPEHRTKANTGVGVGAGLQLFGLFMPDRNHLWLLGAALILIGTALFLRGCMHYAEGKGHSKWVGLVGLAGIVGLIILIILPDQHRIPS